MGASIVRMQTFSENLLALFDELDSQVHAWCVLPNHYHLLVNIRDLSAAISALGKLHGRTSHAWNSEDNLRGRKVWSPPADRLIRSENHF